MALKGVKVLELAGLAPVPFCGMVLADFGASVIRVDRVTQEPQFDCLGNGKKSIAVNLKSNEGVNVIRSLVKKSDVIIEPFRKGVMEKLGLGPELLMKDNPRLIYARLTGYGQHGSFSTNAGHDINYISLSGLLSLFGRKNDKPLFPINYGADFAGGGLTCTLGILLALHERNFSGLGQVVDCSMVEGTAYVGSWLYRSQNLPIWGRQRGANLLDTGMHFYEVYETKDGKHMSVGALEPQFYELLLEGLGISAQEAPHFGDGDELKPLFEAKFKEKTQKEWCDIFDGVDACVSPILSLQEAAEHPHNKERGSFITTDDGIVPKPAPVLSRTPGESCGVKAAPSSGDHTKEILMDELGYSEDQVNGLCKNGHIKLKSKM